MPCSQLNVNRHLGGTCRVYLQGRRISHKIIQSEEGSKQALIAGFLLGLFLDSEYVGAISLRNVG
jgi:hypothetical protein